MTFKPMKTKNITPAEFYILAQYFFNPGTCYAPDSKPHPVRNPHTGNLVTFSSRKAAAAEYNEDGVYLLRHGEFARPSYRVRKVRVNKPKAACP